MKQFLTLFPLSFQYRLYPIECYKQMGIMFNVDTVLLLLSTFKPMCVMYGEIKGFAWSLTVVMVVFGQKLKVVNDRFKL